VPDIVDVIIPVYRGLAETQRCVQSVMAAHTSTARQIVVVDDASPEPALSAWLAERAAEGSFTLIKHVENRGFVASVNEGMRLHPDRDVVLLNADTEVATGWLDRIAALAAREAHVGTITPFSNNATICSYPRFGQSNPLPAGETTASLDAHFAQANRGKAVDIPVGVGFCLYIRRECLDDIGEFDEAKFGKGYGEEVAFCMQAAKAGYRHLLAADVFVFHQGEVSFGASSVERKAGAQAIVDDLHPEFQPLVRDFVMREPARPLRAAVDLARLRASARPRVLFVSHAWEGGVGRHLRDLAAALADDCEVLLLKPYSKDLVSLSWMREGEAFEAFFDPRAEWDTLVALLGSLGLARVHLHHVHGLPQRILALPAELGVPYDCTVHDYFPICPQYHLATPEGRYCGEPDEAGCTRCLAGRPPQWPIAIGEWRNDFGDFLGKAARVIAPSHDVAGRLKRHFPALPVMEWAHAEAPAAVSVQPIKVLVIGGLSRAKGIDVLEACVADARARALPLHFRVVGHLARPLAQWPDAPLSITGEYREDTLDELLRLEQGQLVLFAAQVPESFSYTLSAAMRTALPIVASDLGALPERLAAYPDHALVAWNAPAAVWNDALMAMATRGQWGAQRPARKALAL
jgi:GT2 family glycosyltransferase/glycosyltransferase involved in cell wall biosynthesis